MTVGKESESFEESSEDFSKSTTLNAGSSVESSVENENSLSTASCSAILEPSEDEPLLYERTKIKKPYQKYKAAIMQSYNSTEININSDEPSIEEENVQQKGRVLSACLYLLNLYTKLAVRLRNSKLIYLIQALYLAVSLCTMWMGIKYNESCPGAPGLTELSSVTGMLSFLLVCQWVVIRSCRPLDRPCEGQQKFLILFFFIMVAAFLEFEIYIFCNSSPSFEPSSLNYCSQAFYDYTYYKFICAFVLTLQVVLIYFPDYWSFASGLQCSDPATANCYREAMEQSS